MKKYFGCVAILLVSIGCSSPEVGTGQCDTLLGKAIVGYRTHNINIWRIGSIYDLSSNRYKVFVNVSYRLNDQNGQQESRIELVAHDGYQNHETLTHQLLPNGGWCTLSWYDVTPVLDSSWINPFPVGTADVIEE